MGTRCSSRSLALDPCSCVGDAMVVGKQHCSFRDFNNNYWVFEEWIDAQGVHYAVSDPAGMTIAESVNMSMSFQSWVQDLIKQAMDDTYGGEA